MLNPISDIEAEVEEMAKQRHAEVITRLFDKLSHKNEDELMAAKNRYVSLKLMLHRMKRQFNNGIEFFIWGHEGGRIVDKEKFVARYNDIASKLREAKIAYHQMVDNK